MLRSSCPYAPGVSARPAGLRSPSIHPSCPDSAGEWASTFACRRDSSTSSLTSSRPATIEYFHEVLLLPLAASSRAFIASERRLHHEHRRRPGRRAGAQVGEGALVVGGGEWRGSEHGVDPPRWASRSSVQETCIPSRGERELDLIFPLLPAIRRVLEPVFKIFDRVRWTPSTMRRKSI